MMQEEVKKSDEEIWKEIYEQFNKIKEEIGIEPDEEYRKELEDMFGMSIEDMNEETTVAMLSQNIEVEMIHPDAIFPSYNYPSDSGFDLYSVEETKIQPFGRALLSTGLKFGFQEGYEIQIRTKSGLAINQGLMVLNSPGTMDQGYTGECKVPMFNANPNEVTIPKGMKIAQAVLCPVKNGKYVNLVSVDKIGEKDRGENGFGSTGI
jgi:dUTP pyrophosphatase